MLFFRLFVPPVESDVPPKPAAKGPIDPSHARSPIRRSEQRRRQIHEAREQRLRMLAALQARDHNSLQHGRNSLQPSSSTRTTSRPADAHRISERLSPRLENPRISELNQHLELERRYLAQIVNGDLSRDLATDETDDEIPPLEGELALGSVYREPVDSHQYNTIVRYRALGYPTAGLPGRSRWRRASDRDSEESRYRRRRHIEQLSQSTSLNPTAAHRHSQRVRYVDGLGDRDRSLSPGSDSGVWDRLQSTVTLDPQLPSIGSSFTSTVVSTTTQVNEADSVNTSMTTPVQDTEPPCDPLLDNFPSDGEDDVGDPPIEPSRQPTPHGRRSYADVAAESHSRQSPEPADPSDQDREWLSGMHRIVRGLASRVDIPEEWWLQAGLSRSMSWEDSN